MRPGGASACRARVGTAGHRPAADPGVAGVAPGRHAHPAGAEWLRLTDNGQMPAITIDTASATPPFEQVRSQLAGQIQSGQLPVGARLPTVRALAASLGLAANTVARAFGELEHAGLVCTSGRAGTTVSAAGSAGRARTAAAARQYATTALSLGLSTEEALDIVRAALEGPAAAAARADAPVPAEVGQAG